MMHKPLSNDKAKYKEESMAHSHHTMIIRLFCIQAQAKANIQNKYLLIILSTRQPVEYQSNPKVLPMSVLAKNNITAVAV